MLASPESKIGAASRQLVTRVENCWYSWPFTAPGVRPPETRISYPFLSVAPRGMGRRKAVAKRAWFTMLLLEKSSQQWWWRRRAAAVCSGRMGTRGGQEVELRGAAIMGKGGGGHGNEDEDEDERNNDDLDDDNNDSSRY